MMDLDGLASGGKYMQVSTKFFDRRVKGTMGGMQWYVMLAFISSASEWERSAYTDSYSRLYPASG